MRCADTSSMSTILKPSPKKIPQNRAQMVSALRMVHASQKLNAHNDSSHMVPSWVALRHPLMLVTKTAFPTPGMAGTIGVWTGWATSRLWTSMPRTHWLSRSLLSYLVASGRVTVEVSHSVRREQKIPSQAPAGLRTVLLFKSSCTVTRARFWM